MRIKFFSPSVDARWSGLANVIFRYSKRDWSQFRFSVCRDQLWIFRSRACSGLVINNSIAFRRYFFLAIVKLPKTKNFFLIGINCVYVTSSICLRILFGRLHQEIAFIADRKEFFWMTMCENICLTSAHATKCKLQFSICHYLTRYL